MVTNQTIWHVCPATLQISQRIHPFGEKLVGIMPSLYCVYTMFPAAPAAPFARNVALRGVLVIYFSDFQDLLRFVTFSYVVLRYPSHPVVVISRCVTEALRYVMVIHDLSRL